MVLILRQKFLHMHSKFSLIKNDRSEFLLSKLKRLEGVNLRNRYQVPGFNLTVGKYSFSRVASKILNTFIFSY